MHAFRVWGVNKHAKPILQEMKLVFLEFGAQEVVQSWQLERIQIAIRICEIGVEFHWNLNVVWLVMNLMTCFEKSK
jgi:hypothetical protein